VTSPTNAARIAGYHGDADAFAGLCSRMSNVRTRQLANAWKDGVRARRAGVRCDCAACAEPALRVHPFVRELRETLDRQAAAVGVHFTPLGAQAVAANLVATVTEGFCCPCGAPLSWSARGLVCSKDDRVVALHANEKGQADGLH